MIDPIKILQRAWHILWNYRTLWVFGLIVALAAGSAASGNGGSNSSVQTGGQNQPGGQTIPPPTPETMRQNWQQFTEQVQKLFTQGIPEAHITGHDITT